MSCDLYRDRVVFASHFDGAHDSTTLTEINGKNIVNVGVKLKTDEKKFGTASAYFDGTCYAFSSQSTDYDFSNGDFTIECWIRPTSATTSGQYRGIISKRQSSSQTDWTLLTNGDASGAVNFQASPTPAGTPTIIVYGPAPTPLEWNHIAVVRDGGKITVYTNGVGGTPVLCQTVIGFSSMLDVYLGELSSNAPGYRFLGHMDDVRITKGVARYRENFTPALFDVFPDNQCAVSGLVGPSGARLARPVRVYHRDTGDLVGQVVSDGTTGAYSVSANRAGKYFALVHDADGADMNWSNVVLMMSMANSTFIPEKGTAPVLYGNVTRSSEGAFPDGWAAVFDGSGDYMAISGPMGPFALGGDFTVECFIKTTDNNFAILDRYADSASNSYQFGVNASGYLVWYSTQFGGRNVELQGSTNAVNDNNWHHVAATRRSGTLRLFVDGTKVAEVTGNTRTNNPIDVVTVGIGAQVWSRDATYDFSGYMSQLRVTNGVARYTANFTIAQTPLPIGISGGVENSIIYDNLLPE